MTSSNSFLGKILIVDDDPILCAVVSEFLSDALAETIFIAHDGIEALKIFEKNCAELDFILCDLNMPKMDGIQFLRRVTENGYTGPVAILSGEDKSIISIAEKLADSHRMNLVAALSKPLIFDDLKSAILGCQNVEFVRSAVPDETITENQLRIALASGHITNFYQPKLDALTGKFVGAEALARWDCPKKGLIGPDRFIPLAEETGLISDLTTQVINIAFRDGQIWRDLGIKFKTAVNLSVDVLNNLDLPNEIAAKISALDLDRSCFSFEITESRLLEQTAEPMEVLARLRIMGFDLSLDDFGTGYSNIDVVREFPFSELKIDRSFVTNAAADEIAGASVDACVDIGKKLGMRVVAEGVETMDDWKFVASRNVDHIQGYFIAKPMPIDKLTRWIYAYRDQTVNLSRSLKFG